MGQTAARPPTIPGTTPQRSDGNLCQQERGERHHGNGVRAEPERECRGQLSASHPVGDDDGQHHVALDFDQRNFRDEP